MDRCPYFSKCGDCYRHECSHSGNTQDSQRAFCYDQKLQDELIATMTAEEWAQLEKQAAQAELERAAATSIPSEEQILMMNGEGALFLGSLTSQRQILSGGYN